MAEKSEGEQERKRARKGSAGGQVKRRRASSPGDRKASAPLALTASTATAADGIQLDLPLTREQQRALIESIRTTGRLRLELREVQTTRLSRIHSADLEETGY